MEIQNPHDKFFKETLGNVAVARDFLNNYLPQNIVDIIVEYFKSFQGVFIKKIGRSL